MPGFGHFVEQLTQLSRMMGKPQKLQRLLATCADAPEHLPYSAALQSRSYTHCKIYDKRWGSLIAAMELAQEIEGPLRAIWDMDKFLFGGGNPKHARELDLKLFDEAVSSEQFWCYRAVFAEIIDSLSHFTHWAESCACHGHSVILSFHSLRLRCASAASPWNCG